MLCSCINLFCNPFSLNKANSFKFSLRINKRWQVNADVSKTNIHYSIICIKFIHSLLMDLQLREWSLKTIKIVLLIFLFYQSGSKEIIQCIVCKGKFVIHLEENRSKYR